MGVNPVFNENERRADIQRDNERPCPRINDNGQSICSGTLRRSMLISVCRCCAFQFNNGELDSKK